MRCCVKISTNNVNIMSIFPSTNTDSFYRMNYAPLQNQEPSWESGSSELCRKSQGPIMIKALLWNVNTTLWTRIVR